jgi:hypothetical protein
LTASNDPAGIRQQARRDIQVLTGMRHGGLLRPDCPGHAPGGDDNGCGQPPLRAAAPHRRGLVQGRGVMPYHDASSRRRLHLGAQPVISDHRPNLIVIAWMTPIMRRRECTPGLRRMHAQDGPLPPITALMRKSCVALVKILQIGNTRHRACNEVIFCRGPDEYPAEW